MGIDRGGGLGGGPGGGPGGGGGGGAAFPTIADRTWLNQVFAESNVWGLGFRVLLSISMLFDYSATPFYYFFKKT